MTAIISNRPSANCELLAENPKSLWAQGGAVPGRYQDDGWGVSFYDARKLPLAIKSHRPVRLEKSAFTKAATAAVSKVTLAHLRDASNPGAISKKRLVTLANTQPFTGRGLVFAHNGTLFIKDEIKSLLGKYAAKVKGLNDSEILFWQTVKMLEIYGSPVKALEMALDEIRTVWVSCKNRYPDYAGPYRGLNIFLASRTSITALCHYPSAGRNAAGAGRLARKNALLTPGWDFGRVAWRRESGRVIFSSEPADSRPGWKEMNDLQIAHAELKAGRLGLTFTNINLS